MNPVVRTVSQTADGKSVYRCVFHCVVDRQLMTRYHKRIRIRFNYLGPEFKRVVDCVRARALREILAATSSSVKFNLVASYFYRKVRLRWVATKRRDRRGCSLWTISDRVAILENMRTKMDPVVGGVDNRGCLE